MLKRLRRRLLRRSQGWIWLSGMQSHFRIKELSELFLPISQALSLIANDVEDLNEYEKIHILPNQGKCPYYLLTNRTKYQAT